MKLFRFIKLNKIEEKKSGAGELGTSELVNQYKHDTPGEFDEGKMKEISIDLKDLDDKAFKAKYGKTKDVLKKMLKAGHNNPDAYDIHAMRYNQKEQMFYTNVLEEIGLVESNMDKLNDIVKKKQNANIKFKDKSAKVDLYTASAVVGVIKKLNPSNRNKAVDMINKGTLSQFMKLAGLGFKSIKADYQAEGTWHLPKTSKEKKALGKALKGKITKRDENKILKILGDDEVADIFGDARPGEDLSKKIAAVVKALEKEIRKPITEDEEVSEGFHDEKAVAKELKKQLGRKMTKSDIDSYVQDNADNPHKVDQNAVADELKKIGVRVEELEIQEEFEKEVMRALNNYGVKAHFDKEILYVESHQQLDLAKRALDQTIRADRRTPIIVEASKKSKKEAAGGISGVEQNTQDDSQDGKQDQKDAERDKKKNKLKNGVNLTPSMKDQITACENEVMSASDTDDEEGDGDNTTTDETQMTDAQMKKREDIVKGMKDKISEFKKKYGERWKEVMYATATKLALQDDYKPFKWTKKS